MYAWTEGGALIDNLDFDRPKSWVSCCVECRQGVLEGESMGDERFEVDQTSCDEPNGFRVLVTISVYEGEVNLVGAEMHERELHLATSHSDDHDFTTELCGEDRGVDATFEASAFQDYVDGTTSRLCYDNCLLLRFGILVNENGMYARNQRFCKVQTALDQVCDDNGLCSGCSC